MSIVIRADTYSNRSADMGMNMGTDIGTDFNANISTNILADMSVGIKADICAESAYTLPQKQAYRNTELSKLKARQAKIFDDSVH